MSQFSWPPITTTNASVGGTGSAAPSSANEMGAVNSGNLVALTADGSSNLNVNVQVAVLPTGAASSALQTTGNTSLATIATNTTGASTAANQTTGNTSLASIDTKTPALVTGRVPVDGSGVTQPVSGSVSVSNLPATQAISAAALPLPSGASTSAKQPALGTAGSASTDVISVQGIASMVALKVDGSGVTQPISTASTLPVKVLTNTAGTITQAAITVGTTAVRATVSGSAPASTRQIMALIADSASTAKFYVGASTVTSSGATRGFQLLAGMPFQVSNDAGDYWIISDTAAQTVYVMEQS